MFVQRGGVTLRIIRFLQNKGLGEALRVAIEKCRYELIARMDSDDIAVANRFATQLMYFRSDDIDVCGGQIEEFLDSPSHVIGKRIVPLTDSGIKTYMKKRCPFNHMTVMYKKSAVLEAGNYQDWFWNEDYYLWIRMYLAGMKFGNVPETLVLVRTGEDMYSRRGGRRYFHSEIGLQKLMLKEKMITPLIYFGNCTKRFVLQLFLPNSVRGWVFKTFARSRRDIEY